MSENLHLDGNFTLNIPSYEANFTENEQPDIQADFNISVNLNYKWLEINLSDWVQEGDLYKYTYSGLYSILSVYKQVENTLNLILVNVEVQNWFIYLYCQEPFDGKALVTDVAGEIRNAGVFTFEQGISSDNWVIHHNLNTKPTVTVVDSSNKVVIGAIEYIDNNTVQISFSAPFTGQAYLNYTR